MNTLTQERLKDVLSYDQHTGVFTWLKAWTNSIKSGQVAGSQDGKGYTLIRLDGYRYQASRLAFFWMTGAWPVNNAEHRDGNPQNNRWVNLRDATVTQNMQNKRIQSNNKSGIKGVWKHNLRGRWTGKWRARIKVSEGYLHLGLFDCPAAAHMAYAVAADIHFGEFARAA